MYNTYLRLALFLSNKFDIYKALSDNDITPGYPYKISDIMFILKRRYKLSAFNPICKLYDYKVYLTEMRICLDLNFNLV